MTRLASLFAFPFKWAYVQFTIIDRLTGSLVPETQYETDGSNEMSSLP